MDVGHILFTLPQVILRLVALFLVGARVPKRERTQRGRRGAGQRGGARASKEAGNR